MTRRDGRAFRLALISSILMSRHVEAAVITGIDHVQLAMPRGREDAARSFYAGLLGRADGEIPGVRRFHTSDPFGNRVEFQQA
jgi:hypothetical protein